MDSMSDITFNNGNAINLRRLLLIRLTPLGGVLFAGLAILSVATTIEPLVGLAATLFLAPLWAYLRAEVPQIPAQISQWFLVLTLAVWLARGLARRRLRFPFPFGRQARKAEGTPVLLPLLLFGHSDGRSILAFEHRSSRSRPFPCTRRQGCRKTLIRPARHRSMLSRRMLVGRNSSALRAVRRRTEFVREPPRPPDPRDAALHSRPLR